MFAPAAKTFYLFANGFRQTAAAAYNLKPTDLRGILQYIPRFRDKTFVIGIDGAIVTDENFANILLDVAVLRSLNIRVVLVHGASAQIRGANGLAVDRFGNLYFADTSNQRVRKVDVAGIITTVAGGGRES